MNNDILEFILQDIDDDTRLKILDRYNTINGWIEKHLFGGNVAIDNRIHIPPSAARIKFPTFESFMDYLRTHGNRTDPDYDYEAFYNDTYTYGDDDGNELLPIDRWWLEELENPGTAHLTGNYKKPMHMTYGGEDGSNWRTDSTGIWHYYTPEDHLEGAKYGHSFEEYQDYWDRNELGGSILHYGDKTYKAGTRNNKYKLGGSIINTKEVDFNDFFGVLKFAPGGEVGETATNKPNSVEKVDFTPVQDIVLTDEEKKHKTKQDGNTPVWRSLVTGMKMPNDTFYINGAFSRDSALNYGSSLDNQKFTGSPNNVSIMDHWFNMLKKNEGYKTYIYKDTKGIPTTGIGWNLNAHPEDLNMAWENGWNSYLQDLKAKYSDLTQDLLDLLKKRFRSNEQNLYDYGYLPEDILHKRVYDSRAMYLKTAKLLFTKDVALMLLNSKLGGDGDAVTAAKFASLYHTGDVQKTFSFWKLLSDAINADLKAYLTGATSPDNITKILNLMDVFAPLSGYAHNIAADYAYLGALKYSGDFAKFVLAMMDDNLDGIVDNAERRGGKGESYPDRQKGTIVNGLNLLKNPNFGTFRSNAISKDLRTEIGDLLEGAQYKASRPWITWYIQNRFKIPIKFE